MFIDDGDDDEDGCLTFSNINFIWKVLMSNMHWLNLITTPIVMLWPELFPSPSYTLWLIETFFLIDIVRKGFTKKPKSTASDNYEIFVEYIRSNLILDLVATIPNVFSGLATQFAFLKIIRVYEVDELYFWMEAVMRAIKSSSSEGEKDDIAYAFSSLSKITILLHYLSCIWIYVGGPDFLDYEVGALPWQYANEDFHGLDKYQIYVFSTYWVFTVITTVGYGDYTGGTTVEYEVTLFLEFFGLVVFTLLQMTVGRIVDSKYHFRHYIEEKQEQIDHWLLTMEKSN